MKAATTRAGKGRFRSAVAHVCDVTTGEVFRDQIIVARHFVDGMRDHLNHPFIGVVRRLDAGGFKFDTATDDQQDVARKFLEDLKEKDRRRKASITNFESLQTRTLHVRERLKYR